MCVIDNFANELLPLIGVHPRCNYTTKRLAAYYGPDGKPLPPFCFNRHFSLEGNIGFFYDTLSCDKGLGKDYWKYRRPKLIIVDNKKSDAHEINRSIEVDEKEGKVRNLRVMIEESNVEVHYSLGRNLKSKSGEMTYINADVLFRENGIKKYRKIVYDSQVDNSIEFKVLEFWVNKNVPGTPNVKKEERYFKVRNNDPEKLYVSGNSIEEYTRRLPNADMAVKGVLYHPEINGTIRIVENVVEFAFPGIMALVDKMFPDYRSFINKPYEQVAATHEEIESSIIPECSGFEPNKSLLWVPKR